MPQGYSRLKSINFIALLITGYSLIIFTELYAQSNLIQSIDFDSQGRTVYALTGNYDSAYVVRYSSGNQEIWNLTKQFNKPFYWISSCVDNNDNIWAYMQSSIYRYDGSNWSEIPLPVNINSYQKYSDLEAVNDFIFLRLYESSVYGLPSIFRYNKANGNWRSFDSSNSDLPNGILTGKIFIKGDSVFIGSNKGLILITNDSAFVILDTVNSSCETESFYSFYIDYSGKKWLGSFDKGLIEWIDNSNFRYFNQDNSALPNNFVNAIDEDSNGNLWIATDSGFAKLSNDTIYSFSSLTSESIAELKIDDQNKIWMGEVGTGRLLVYDGNNLNIITDIYNEIGNLPADFTLYQNFPNPFNPVTKIRFIIPNEVRNLKNFSSQTPLNDNPLVRLKIYDVLGNEVATLINEEKPAGEYEIEFNAAKYNLTSGIYFYKLTAGSFTETRKMILMK
ncbi:two-component regulator propeller domain-containing protein [Ignavibacterium sp.]|uniref:two-component regulator propeller domain-containing protein n=1 Tax=Ignavibacterium sp. TaxID=2651167 RepID=UPI00307DD05E